MSSSYDLIIRGGSIVDGSGGQPYLADIGVRGGLIAAVGEVRGDAPDIIDAHGCVVTPGFVDIHTHYDGQITWEERLQPSSQHGVTTVVMGNCGVGFAPCKSDQHELTIALMEGVEDIPGVVMAEGVPWGWETFPEYLDFLGSRVSDVDFAAQLPHSPLRVYVMGERGLDQAPTADDLAAMRRLTAEAIRAGAVGVSTSHHFNHRFRDGTRAPSTLTGSAELLALAEGLRDAGAGVFQMIPDTDIPVETQFALLEDIARASGRPVSFTFVQQSHDPDGWRSMLGYLRAANAEGLEIRGQVIPHPIGVLQGLELSLHHFALHPSFRAIEHAPLAEKVAAMRDPAMRARLLSEHPEDPNEVNIRAIAEKEMVFVLGDPPNFHPHASESIGAMAAARGVDPLELIYDTLLEKDGKQILYRPGGNALGERFHSAGQTIVLDDHTILGLGDGGAHYGMVIDSGYPTYFLTYWHRDAEPDRRIDLGKAVRMLSHDPAAAAGLHDRGLLRPGFRADINVVDMDRLRLHAPHVAADLPAGGRRLHQAADGYRATIVKGEVTYRDGRATGALPGRLVRGAQPAPLNEIQL